MSADRGDHDKRDRGRRRDRHAAGTATTIVAKCAPTWASAATTITSAVEDRERRDDDHERSEDRERRDDDHERSEDRDHRDRDGSNRRDDRDD